MAGKGEMIVIVVYRPPTFSNPNSGSLHLLLHHCSYGSLCQNTLCLGFLHSFYLSFHDSLHLVLLAPPAHIKPREQCICIFRMESFTEKTPGQSEGSLIYTSLYLYIYLSLIWEKVGNIKDETRREGRCSQPWLKSFTMIFLQQFPIA